MKMVMIVIPKEEAADVLDELVAKGFTATYNESKGGVLHQTRITMYVAIEDKDLDTVLDLVRGYCHSCVSLADDDEVTAPGGAHALHTAEVGGAVVFVWDLQRFFKF